MMSPAAWFPQGIETEREKTQNQMNRAVWGWDACPAIPRENDVLVETSWNMLMNNLSCMSRQMHI